MTRRETVYLYHKGNDYICTGDVYKGYPSTYDMPEEPPYFEALDVRWWSGYSRVEVEDSVFETLAELANKQWLIDMESENV